MDLKRTFFPLFLLFLICFQSILAQEAITISGYVMDEQSHALELVNVSEFNGTKKTLTDKNGYYSIQLPLKDTVILKFTCLSYQKATRIIPVEMRNLRVNVVLSNSSKTLNEITIKGQQRQTNTLETVDASKIRMLPDASGGNIEALLVTFAGVSSNNELSSQYSVRGGNYDENLVYVNGIEVYRPLLIRAGQQEGLSFVNPEMVEDVKFSAGGFDARYGDKMSSVLDIQYKKPKHFEAVDDNTAATDTTPDRHLEKRDQLDTLWAQAKRSLSEREYEVLWLRYAEDMSLEETARIVGLNQTHTKIIAFRARQRLIKLQSSS